MKKLLVLVLVIAFNFCTLSSQRSLYLDGGYNHSSISSDYLFATYEPGYYAGLYFTELFRNNLELSTGMRYNRLSVENSNVKEGYNFFEGVFDIGYRVQPELTLQAGLTIGKLLTESPLLIERELDFGPHIGLKYNFGNTIVKAHFYRSLIDQSPKFEDNEAYFQYFQLGVGFRLTSSKKKSLSDTTYIIRERVEPKLDTIPNEIVDTIQAPFYRHHIGFTFSSLNNFNFVYKKAVAENKLLRFSLLSSGLSSIEGNNNISFGFDLGIEWQKHIEEKTIFVHGPRLAASINGRDLSFSDPNVLLAFKYQLGFYYRFSEDIDVGLELLPQVSYGRFNDNNAFNVRAKTSTANLVVMHRFRKR